MTGPGSFARLGWLFLAIAVLLAGVAAQALWSFLGGLASGADPIDVNTGAAGAVPAAVAIGCWAAVLLARRLTDRAERRIMGLSFLCVPLIVLLPLLFTALADRTLAERGYERCQVEAGRRFPGARYLRGAPELCP